jgi:hypothetical protein
VSCCAARYIATAIAKSQSWAAGDAFQLTGSSAAGSGRVDRARDSP